MSGSNLLFILTGSIACYKACDAISRLVQSGHRVRAVASESALRFIGPATLEGLTGEPVLADLWAQGRALDHIDLTRWADAVVVCPATADTLNRFAAGLAADLPGALFLAADRTKPWLVAPAMNPAMWSHPATTASVEKLSAWGVRFIQPGRGRTACGEFGDGRLAEPDTIVAAIEQAVANPERRLRVLITSGGTAEPIDGVRVLTNTSTGRTGADLARHFIRDGHDVTLLRAANSAPAPGGAHEVLFGSFAELDEALGRLLGTEDYDAIIHAAAVGDFRVASVEADGRRVRPGEKIGSRSTVTLQLAPHPKLIDGLHARSRNPHVAVVAFKLTTGATAEAARTAVAGLFAEAAPDYVVHNDLAARTAAAFPAAIWTAGQAAPLACADRGALARELAALLSRHSQPA